MATTDSLDRGFAQLPLRWTLASAIGWALIFLAVGHIATPLLKAGADGAMQGLMDWTSGRLRDTENAPVTLDAIVSGFILWILSLPFMVVFGAFTVVLGIVAALFMLFDQSYGFAVVGFLAGLQPGRHVQPFGQVADRLGWIGRLLGLSAIQGFTVRGARNRIWAIAPVVMGLIAAALAWLTVVPAMRQQGLLPGPTPTLSVVRYEPTPSWQSANTSGEWRFELRQVVLTPRRLEASVRCHFSGFQSARFRIDPQTLLESYKPGRLGFMNERQVLSKERLPLRWTDMGHREIEVPANDYRDVTLYFERPEFPHQHWGLTVYAGTTPTGGTRVPFVFQLPG
jgi:hypothetical protein